LSWSFFFKFLCLFIEEKSYLPPDDEHTSADPYARLSIGITQCLRDYEGEINHAKRRINDVRSNFVS
jgi:hypothetical protein